MSRPRSVRPVVVVDPPTVIDPEPVLIEPEPVTSAALESATADVPVSPAANRPAEDPIFFPTSPSEGSEAAPPPVALEVPVDASGAPPPTTSSGSATSWLGYLVIVGWCRFGSWTGSPCGPRRLVSLSELPRPSCLRHRPGGRAISFPFQSVPGKAAGCPAPGLARRERRWKEKGNAEYPTKGAPPAE